MKCPIDNTDLLMSDRQGVEIDYCPQCRGIWLDRSELDKIIERSATEPAVNNTRQPSHTDPMYGGSPAEFERPQKQPYEKKQDYYGERNYNQKKKREGFLGDLFDF